MIKKNIILKISVILLIVISILAIGILFYTQFNSMINIGRELNNIEPGLEEAVEISKERLLNSLNLDPPQEAFEDFDAYFRIEAYESEQKTWIVEFHPRSVNILGGGYHFEIDPQTKKIIDSYDLR